MGVLASVVVPVYNGMPHLRALVDALLRQDYPDLEIIFSDGGSSDGSLEFLQTIEDPRVRVMTIPSGLGAAANWTAVTEAAQGEFIKLVCQDDLITPDAITKQIDDLQRHPAAVMALAQRDIVDAKGDLLYSARGAYGLSAGELPGVDVIRACWRQGTNILGEPLAVMFRRRPLMDAMPWEDPNPLVLDLMLYEKVAQQGSVVVRRGSVGAFRVSTSSWSTRLASEQRRQFTTWQREYEAAMPSPPSTLERLRARSGMHLHATLRRGAYAWLRMKGAFHST